MSCTSNFLRIVFSVIDVCDLASYEQFITNYCKLAYGGNREVVAQMASNVDTTQHHFDPTPFTYPISSTTSNSKHYTCETT